MGFIENIKNCIGVEQLPKEQLFRAVIFGESAVYFENVKGLYKYTPEEILLTLRKGFVSVKGENLYIKKFCSGDVVVCGKIKGVERV